MHILKKYFYVYYFTGATRTVSLSDLTAMDRNRKTWILNWSHSGLWMASSVMLTQICPRILGKVSQSGY